MTSWWRSLPTPSAWRKRILSTIERKKANKK